MIPWMKEKFAERRARWFAARNKQQDESNFPNRNRNSKNETKQLSIEDGCDVALSNSSNSKDEPMDFDPNIISIRIVSPKGTVANIKFPKSATGFDVKQEALKVFGGYLVQSPNELDNFKLIRARIQFLFDESLSLAEAQINDNDELLLLNYRTIIDDRELIGDLKAPQQSDINRATNGIPGRKLSLPVVNINELVLQSDIQYDIRQIVISLAQSAAYIIGTGPYAKRLIEMFKQRLIQRRQHERDNLQSLIEMGFDRRIALQALQLTSDVYSDALDWLIDNQNATASISLVEISPTASFTVKLSNSNGVKGNVESLLEIIRIYCQRYSRPSPEMVQRIKEMGFSEQEVQESLKITRNNYAEACEWLTGNRTTKKMNKNYDGLAADSPILKALLSSPHVQLSLSNPKAFIAYLSILENYASMNMWLSDIETAGIIGHILRTYHEEKHILAINKLSGFTVE